MQRRCPRGEWKEWKGAESSEAANAWQRSRGRFFFVAGDRDGFAPVLRGFDGPGTGPEAEAKAAANGSFRYFSFHQHRLGTPPDWFLDPWSGRHWDSGGHWSRTRDFAGGDIKVLWEPSRFGFVFPLVRAHWRTGDAAHAETFWGLVESWRAANPPNTGPNWRCGQEATFRAMAWMFGLWGFEGAPASTPTRIAMLLEMLEATGRRIEAHVGYALSQRNNHGISEAVGLFTLGTLFPWWPRAAAWEALGRRLLDRLAGELVYEDGAFSQHSFNYQRVMLHDYAWAIRLAGLSGRPLADATRERVRRSARLLAEWINPVDGTVPNHGANDGARILPLDNCPFEDHRAAAQLASLAAGGPRLFPVGPWDEASIWILGNGPSDSMVDPVADGARDAAVGGYHGWRKGDAAVFLHVPQFRDRPAHADLLHCDIVLGGVRASRDPGTYSYNAPAPWDHALASTRYHGTVEVDGLDQMEKVSRFVWLPWPRCTVIGRGKSVDGSAEWIDAEHAGYTRLPDPVWHRRRVILWGDGTVVVLDRISGSRPHRARLHWLVPDLPVAAESGPEHAVLQASCGAIVVRLGSRGGKGSGDLVRGKPGDARGWESRHYLSATPALSLEWSETASTVEFWSVFTRDDLECSVGPEGLRLSGPADRQLKTGWPGGNDPASVVGAARAPHPRGPSAIHA